jgi:hypothetical protein
MSDSIVGVNYLVSQLDGESKSVGGITSPYYGQYSIDVERERFGRNIQRKTNNELELEDEP